MFKGRLLYILLILGFSAFCFYLAQLGFRDAKQAYNTFSVEKSSIRAIRSFEENKQKEEGRKYILELASGKEIIVFEGMGEVWFAGLKQIRVDDPVLCRYKADLFQKNMIFGPVELQIGGKEIINFRKNQESNAFFARKMLYLAIGVCIMGLYLLAAVFYVLVKRHEVQPPKNVFWRVGRWLLGENVKI